DAFLRASLGDYLRDAGFQVAEACDGASGLEQVRADPPDLVLLDINMPGMDGFEVCRALRVMTGPEPLPVIVAASLSSMDKVLEAFKSGAVDCLLKPYHFQEAEARVRTHLDLRRKSVRLKEKGEALEKAFFEAAAMTRNLLAVNEKLRRSEEAQSRFLALMRNEIYNPLNDILTLADRIADPSVEPARARSLAALVRMEATFLDFQIRNVFWAAELEAGRARPTITRVDVDSVARDVADSYLKAGGGQGAALTLAAEAGTFPTDGGKLHMILANLMANATARAGHGGLVALSLRVEGERLRVRVEDNGPPLGEEDLREAFKGSLILEGPRGGPRSLALVLPVVRGLVDLLQGGVRVENLPGGGAAFEVHLPPATAEDRLEAEERDGNLIIFDDPQAF
ncbi:MAG TPA: hybrid sensor histidine kinase/response regulator, partial [Holophaga sp.]|nr:hybrid sensor histidine kinase/response regulator [Holophaga sp.]